jgi:hypothetical protein
MTMVEKQHNMNRQQQCLLDIHGIVYVVLFVASFVTLQSQLTISLQWQPESSASRISAERQHQQRRVTTTTSITTKRLLAIRVSSSSSGEVTNESIASIQAAIFGYGTNPDNISLSDGTVIAQYAAMSHGQLLFAPVTMESILNDATISTELKIEAGVFDMAITNVTFDGQPITNLTKTILEQTQNQFGGISSLLDVADHIIFCLPTGSIFNNDPNWTAYTYLNEPYSYYQQSRCTRLSVVVHEVCDYEYCIRHVLPVSNLILNFFS